MLSDWIWCGKCGRCYHYSEARRLGRGAPMLCAYEDCTGRLAVDGWDWKKVRKRSRRLDWPLVPQVGIVYEAVVSWAG